MALPSLKQLTDKLNRPPTDVVALDCVSSEIRILRVRRGGGQRFTVAGAEVQPAVLPQKLVTAPDSELPVVTEPLDLPASVVGRHASLMAAGVGSSVKMMRLPEAFDVSNKSELKTRLGLDRSGEFRIGAKIIQPGRGKVEAHVLGAAMRASVADALIDLMPKVGAPAPRAIQLSELGVIQAFSKDPVVAIGDKAVGFIHFDHDYCIIALFNAGLLSQLRTSRLGAAAILKRVSNVLSCDEETAAGVLMDGAFDISGLIEQDAREVCGQYVICRDYMERSENCHVEELYVSGPVALAKSILSGGRIVESQKEWNPLARFDKLSDEVMAPALSAEPWRWAAAIGGCLGLLEGE